MQIRFRFTLSGFTLLKDALVHLKIHEQPYSETDLQPSNEPAIQKHLRHQPFGLASPDKKQIGDLIQGKWHEEFVVRSRELKPSKLIRGARIDSQCEPLFLSRALFKRVSEYKKTGFNPFVPLEWK